MHISSFKAVKRSFLTRVSFRGARHGTGSKNPANTATGIYLRAYVVYSTFRSYL